MQRYSAYTNLENIFVCVCVCVKNAFFVHFVKYCVFIFWNACSCSVNPRLGGVRDFRPDF